MAIARWLRNPLVWAPVSLALLGLLAWRTRVWEIGGRLAIVDPLALVGALALSGVVPILWASRSADLLAAAGHPVPIRSLVPLTAFANTINNLTPASSGELMRVWLLRAHHGVAYSAGAAVVAIERIGAFGYLAGSAVVVWLTLAAGGSAPVAAVAMLAIVVAPGVAYALGARPSALVRILPAGRVLGHDRWERATTWLGTVDEVVASLVGHPVRLATFAAITFGILSCYTAQLVLVGRALGIALEPLPAWGALGIAISAGVLSLLPFGLGSADLVLVGLLSSIGVDPGGAAAIAFGYRLVSTLPLGLVGVASYAWLSSKLPAGGIEGAGSEVAVGLDDAR